MSSNAVASSSSSEESSEESFDVELVKELPEDLLALVNERRDQWMGRYRNGLCVLDLEIDDDYDILLTRIQDPAPAH